MIVTVENVLKLPSMASAKVAAGNLYLWRKITAVKVISPSAQMVDIEDASVFCRSYLIVTSFDEIWDEPQMQKRFIRKVVRSEAAGLVVFSTVPGRNVLSEEIINEAEENCLPVLCLPGASNLLQCGQLVGDIGNLLRENENEGAMTVTMLETMSRSLESVHSVQAATELVSEWVNASTMLTDEEFCVLAEKSYGALSDNTVSERIRRIAADGLEIPPLVDGIYVYTTALSDPSGKIYHLFLLRPVRIEQQEFRVAVNAMQLAVNFWSKKSIGASTSELISAMLQDEPLKKCRLAALLHIDVAQMDSLWILHCCDTSENALHQRLEALRDVVDCCNTQVLMDIYEKCIVMFLSMPSSVEEVTRFQNDILEAVEEQDVLFCINNLPNTTEVRNIYAGYKRTVADIMQIYPLCRVFSDAHINMTLSCHATMLNSPNYADILLSPLHKISGKAKAEDMKQFLTTYLLDANLDINLLSKMTYLHRNTVKYRIKALSDVFGFNLGSFPETHELMLVAAISRLQGMDA